MTSRVLAIDVTGPGGGAALLFDEKLTIGLIPPAVARGRDLVPEVARLLEESGTTLEQLEGIACAVGPGSFTGIRIGIATAATLAYAAHLPVVAIGSLHGMAASAPESERDVAVVLNARREYAFAARFRRPNTGQNGGRLELVGEYRHVPAAELAEELAPLTYVMGDARSAYPALFERFPGSANTDVHPDAVARIGARDLAAGRGIDASELRPLYLRLSDPELRRANAVK